MSFSARETSLSAGQPIRLYEFQRGIIRWRYTNADRDIEYQTQTFASDAISDDGIRQSGEASVDALKIRVPWNSPIARLYRSVPPASEIEVIVRDIHYGDTEADIRFMGTIQSVRYPSPERAEITCQSLAASLDNPGLSLGWERGCPYSVYDHNCKVSPALFGVDAILSVVSALTIESGTFDSFEDGYFAGGYVEWPIGSGEFDSRNIEAHVDDVLTLMGGTDGILTGQAVTAYPGCPGTIEVCNDRFDNKDNHGGFKDLPGESPFSGDPIF